MDFRTDLAIERREILDKDDNNGVITQVFEDGNVKFTKIIITNQSGADLIGKPVGTYVTAEIPSLMKRPADNEDIINSISKQIKSLLPENGTILVAGLGNDDITPDAVGPYSASMILATRHLDGEFLSDFGMENIRSVAAFVPGVLGKTGVEAAESISGIVKSVKPSCVIVIDALAARKVSRLGKTVQISDTGIVPGSGVGNSRNAVNKDTLGVPVISIGIPTVVDAQTLVNDLTDCGEIKNLESENMIVTPREIDLVVERSAEIIALSVNRALQPQLSVEEILMLVGN